MERHEALTETVELLTRDIQDLTRSTQDLTHDTEGLKATAKQDGENIRALARIAEIHERRISAIEGGPGVS